MSITTEIRQTVDDARAAIVDAKPVRALAGAGDLLAERLRALAETQQKALKSMRFEPSAVPALLNAKLGDVRTAITGLPERAQDVFVGKATQVNHVYDDLAKRGATVVHGEPAAVDTGIKTGTSTQPKLARPRPATTATRKRGTDSTKD